ncbi:MAG: transglutaminase domain-containing protein, partial [Pseudomonadota bacterium]
KQGNAFDTASLLIALLRVSGIHARYAIGTVEIPMEKFMNWAGGFTDPYAALDFFASGGIPIKGLTSGSKIEKAQMEHVWVEAYVDYIPSRGARHKVGDTWISLDPSFKQYNYTEGMDIQAAVPFDAETFIEQVEASATINEAEGYATGIDSLLIQDTLQDYQSQVENYISQDHPDATVGDVLGKKEIITQEFSYLLGTLPYRTAVKGGSYASLPDTLRHKITFEVAKDSFGDIPLYITKSIPELAGKKITLSYSPATPEDEAVISSYLPEPHPDGTPIEPEELPASLPAYLINVMPELRIDGQIAATGAAVGLGSTETFTMRFYDPSGSEGPIINTIDAGSYMAIGLNLGRIAKNQVDVLKTKLEETKAKLESQDYTNITKDDILGDLLYTTALMYHAELDVTNFIAAKTIGVGANTLPSEAIFSSQLKVDTFFGIPRSVSEGGLAMDADRLLNVVKALDGDNNKAIQFMLSSGMNSSALEHEVPEKLFSTPNDPAEGISAVKALKIANDQGIPIYTIKQSNIATILPQLQIDPLAKMDIENAVNAGKLVTVSKTNITFNAWNGCGYIIIDPETGAGAYMISGGLAGALVFLGLLAFTLVIFGILLITATLALAAPLCCAVIGQILIGLAGVSVLSQVLSDNAKAEIKLFASFVLERALPYLAAIGFPYAFGVAVVALVVINFFL